LYRYSGFANTNFDFLLKQRIIDQVVIAGMCANTCIDTTARHAVELGYRITLIKDGIAAFNWD
jgi:nicotinamidase-related amidase